MSRTITSGSITYIDTTDSRKLDIYIANNMPTVQIYNPNNQNPYSPDWATNNLTLTASIYLDSIDVTNNEGMSIIWDKQIGTNVTSDIARGKTLTIKDNIPNTNNIVTYICRASYKGVSSQSKIDFTRVDAGVNGTNGSPAPAVQAKYSVDGQTGWTSTLNAATHKYIKYSYDGGINWTTAIKMVGEDGTSVHIKGTATSRAPVSGTSYYTLVYNSATITGATIGDAYLLETDGHLYVCVDSRDGNDHFMDVGKIQGPPGNDGNSEYVYIRYATNASGTEMTSTPSSTTTHIGICVSTATSAPTTASSYTWSKFVGESAKSIILSGNSQVFKVSKSNTTTTYTPNIIKVQAKAINTSVATWEYSPNGGLNWYSTLAGVELDIATKTVTITGASLTSNSVVIKASDGSGSGSVEDVFTVYKAFDGTDGSQGKPGDSASMAFLTNENVTFAANSSGQIPATSITTNVVAYNGTTKVTPIIDAINNLPTGMTVTPNKGTAYSSVVPTVDNLIVSDLYSDTDLKTKINKTLLVNGDSFVVGDYLYKYNSTNQNFVCQTVTADGKTSLSSIVVNNEVILTFSISNNSTLGSANSILNTKSIDILVKSPISTSLRLFWNKVNAGAAGTPAITFQIYAQNGYMLTKETPSLTLQTFAYEGSTAITSGATYQWSQLVDGAWTAISGATSATYTVTQSDVLKAKSYRCVMTYKSNTYTSTATVQDKTDIYNSIMCISSNASGQDCYWVLYTLVYTDTEEVDPLLGPVSIDAPTSPANGDYWYAVDASKSTVTLKKYNGSSWADSTDTQSLSYYWDLINNGSAQVPLGASSKVKVVSCNDFTATATLVCEVSNVEDGLLTQSSLSITDASDPIVSADEPTSAVDGQIWIKPNSNGTYLMFVWDASLNNWISSDMDSRTKVYTSRPTAYNIGDLWVTASDADHGSYLQGTLLQAQKSSTVYTAADWSPTLRYDQDIDEMKNTLNNLSQYVTITSAGLRIGARNTSGELSPFTSLFTSTELSFYQNSEKLLTLANNQLTAPRIVVEDDLAVQGSISLGDLKIIIESNGSFSFVVQK